MFWNLYNSLYKRTILDKGIPVLIVYFAKPQDEKISIFVLLA